MKKISQREARRLRKRVSELEAHITAQKYRWASEWPSGVVLHRITPNSDALAVVRTARALRHAVVATIQDDKLTLFGCEL